MFATCYTVCHKIIKCVTRRAPSMPIDREITKPMLGANQEPTALTWKSTLRSPTASPRGPRQSRSRTRSSGLATSSLRSRTPSPTLQSLGKESNLRKSSSGKLGTSFGRSTEMQAIEGDYVKNLQQQIYFLELEANFLREQAKKATEMHPQMTSEAERMLSKLRELQGDVDDYQVELRRKDASLQLLNDEKYKILVKLTQEEDNRQRMRQLLQEEIAEIKSERDQITLENVRLDNQVQRLMAEKENTSSKLRESQNLSAVIRSQLNEKTEQQRLLQLSLEEKRSQCMEAETRAERVEEHYLSTTQIAHEQQIEEYKTEIRLLTQQLKEQERQAHDERYLKNKTQDDNDKLAKTNMLLQRQVDEVEDQVLKEQRLRDELEASQTEDMVKISAMADKEKELRLTMRSTQHELTSEKERSNRYLGQLRVEKEEKANLESTNNSIKMELIEMETKVAILEKENSNLRKDKEILTDHVADLQGQMAHKESQLTNRKQQIRELERELNMAESERMADEHMQSDKWKEFETLADGMKKLSRTMARTSNATSPKSSMKMN